MAELRAPAAFSGSIGGGRGGSPGLDLNALLGLILAPLRGLWPGLYLPDPTKGTATLEYLSSGTRSFSPPAAASSGPGAGSSSPGRSAAAPGIYREAPGRYAQPLQLERERLERRRLYREPARRVTR